MWLKLREIERNLVQFVIKTQRIVTFFGALTTGLDAAGKILAFAIVVKAIAGENEMQISNDPAGDESERPLGPSSILFSCVSHGLQKGKVEFDVPRGAGRPTLHFAQYDFGPRKCCHEGRSLFACLGGFGCSHLRLFQTFARGHHCRRAPGRFSVLWCRRE